MELVSALTDTSAKPRVHSIGECMVELSRTVLGGRSWNLGHGGDSYNVAAYMNRLGCDVAYVTALGSDEFSADLRAAFTEEGVDTRHVLSHPTRTVGLYAIRVDERGERSFTYWRGESAARALFECDGVAAAMADARTTNCLYVSGITLSLFGIAGRMELEQTAAAVRRNGGIVAFDTNYRPRGWASVEAARAAITDFARHASILLPTLEDDQALFGDRDADSCAARWHGLGVGEVVVKLGSDGAYVSADGRGIQVRPTEVFEARDTTGAGDSFNAGYLSARLGGHSPEAAAQRGNMLAGVVVRHAGAIIPKLAMPLQARGAAQ